MRTFDYVVIGASGKVGSALCMSLRARGSSVAGVARWRDQEVRDELRALGVKVIPFDALKDDPSSLPPARAVILEVWEGRDLTSLDAYGKIWALNFDAIVRIALRYAGSADFVNGSTGSVYGPHLQPRSEDDPCRPDTDYGRARMAQERMLTQLAARKGSRVAHLRYYHSNCTRSGPLRDIAKAVLAGTSLGNSPDERLQAIGRSDFVRCTLEAAIRLAKEPLTVNICHPRIWSKRELAERLHAELGRGRVVFDTNTGGAGLSYTGDPSKMESLFGPPKEDLDSLIEDVARAAAAEN